MRAVVQRVTSARVEVDDETVGAIDAGFLVLLGVADGDTDDDVAWIVRKLEGLRIFRDDEGAMNRSILEAGGSILLVSQFTLLGDARKGRRPSFIAAAVPEEASRRCDEVADGLRAEGIAVETGRFGAMMQVSLTNDGPVTILVDSRDR